LFIQAALAAAAIGLLALPSAPLAQCVVTNVRNPRERTEIIRVDGAGRDRVLPVVVARTITVSLDCSIR
jgi:hypothetical protein